MEVSHYAELPVNPTVQGYSARGSLTVVTAFIGNDSCCLAWSDESIVNCFRGCPVRGAGTLSVPYGALEAREVIRRRERSRPVTCEYVGRRSDAVSGMSVSRHHDHRAKH